MRVDPVPTRLVCSKCGSLARIQDVPNLPAQDYCGGEFIEVANRFGHQLGLVVDESRYVTQENGPRLAGRPDNCFYCHARLGHQHEKDCVLLVRRVRVRLIVEYEVEVPADWDEHMILFHRNEGTWCSSNAIEELEKRYNQDDGPCLCEVAHFEVVGRKASESA